MRLIRYLALPAYSVATLFIVLTITDTALSDYPFRLSDVAWRFGVVGLISRALLSPVFGLLIAYAVALLLEHRRVQRALSVISALGVVTLASMVGVFALDALQLRARVKPPTTIASFDFAVVAALVKYAAVGFVLATIAVAAWKTSRRLAVVVKGTRQPSQTGLFVARSAVSDVTRAVG